jgi:hypothetical protein
MDFPWRAVTLTSAFATYLVTARWSSWTFSGLLGTYAAVWLLQGFLVSVWAVIIYPNFLSPLRVFPSPEGGSLFMGQLKKIREMPTGHPQREWYVASRPTKV